MNKISLIFCALLAAMMLNAKPVVDYDFTGEVLSPSGSPAPEYIASPQLTKQGLKLDGKKQFLRIPGNFSIANGATFYAVVDLADREIKAGKPSSYDMIFFRRNNFLLGRDRNAIYFNLGQNGKFDNAVVAKFNADSKNLHVAATVSKIPSGCEVALYLNDRLLTKKKFSFSPTDLPGEFSIGKGWGGPWYFNGNIKRILAFERALTHAELSKIFKKNGGIAAPQPPAAPKAKKVKKTAAPSLPYNYHGRAKAVGDTVKLDGINAYVTIKSSEKINVSPKGLTVAFLVKMNDSGTKGAKGLDMFFYKPRHFIFGRNGKNLYLNFYNKKDCDAALYAPAPKAGEWVHLAAVISRFEDIAQGKSGYDMAIYVNGELAAQRQVLNYIPHPSSKLFDIGRGWGGSWQLNGEFKDAVILEKALTGGEIYELVKKSLPALAKAAADAAASPESRYVNQVMAAAAQKRPLHQAAGWKIADNGEIIALIRTAGKSGHPLQAVLRKKDGSAVVTSTVFNWEVTAGKKSIKCNIPFTVKNYRFDPASKKISFTAFWQNPAPFKAEISSNITIFGKRLEADLEVKNLSSDTLIDQVTFPLSTFAKPGNNDVLFHPWQSGVEVADPLIKRFIFGQNGTYPSGRVSLQFGAYYGSKGGIYFACEDPDGLPKHYETAGRRGELFSAWRHPVAWKIGQKGLNNFKFNGKAVVELYDGRWYEAGRIYRKFLQTKAFWWPKKLPRTYTSEKARSQALTLTFVTLDEERGMEQFNELCYLQSYFDLPVTVFWNVWDDPAKGSWPNFYAKDFVIPMIGKLQKQNILCRPYTDGRLWALLDGPYQKSDSEYTKVGIPCAVKQRDGSIPLEIYGSGKKTTRYAVMCPGSKVWQDRLVYMLITTANYGFEGIYNDQIATAAPLLCFDPAHGHDINDPWIWHKGYREVFKQVRAKVGKIMMDSEEFSEPYLEFMDAAHVWRWSYAGQVPMVQALYSGRIQFTGRLGDAHKPGDPDALFVKAAVELVNSEMIGYYMFNELSRPDMRRIYLKQLGHIRMALLHYFNEGEMLPPIRFKGKVPMLTTRWGAFYTPQEVTMPQIIANSYQAPRGKIWIFANSGKTAATVYPQIAGKNIWRCRQGEAEPVRWKPGSALTMAALKTEVWTDSAAEARKLQQIMRKIDTFDGGIDLTSLVKFPKSPQLQLRKGQLLSPAQAGGLFRCSLSPDKKHAGYIGSGSLIYFGEVDFGSKPVNAINIRLASSPNYPGGIIELLCGKLGAINTVAGVKKVQPTASFHDFQVRQMKLDKPLAGKHHIIFRFTGNACCNFAGWGI